MKRLGWCMVLAGSVAALSSSARAGAQGEALRFCVVRAVTPVDKQVLGETTFAELAQHPAARSYASVSPGQLEALQRREALVFERLFFTDCRAQTISALKAEGVHGIDDAAQALGKLAINSLTMEPTVAAASNRAFDLMDPRKLDAVLKDAGLATPSR